LNKVIIIGNGFDLAHGIRTSYNDFIENYFRKTYWKSLYPKKYSDRLIEVKDSYPVSQVNPVESNKISYTEFFYNNRDNYQIISDFFCTLLENRLIENWVDFEDLLFKELFKHVNIPSREINIEQINTLNEDFEFLRSKLIDYLYEITNDIKLTPDQRYTELFTRGINWNSDSLTFVNFNYTKTIDYYIEKCNQHFESKSGRNQNPIRIRKIDIHGSLNDDKNPPIFGIGDEHHVKYKAIKDFEQIRIILKNSKSFWYQLTKNYKNLMQILNAKQNWKVEIYGHACGLLLT
jgi:hypothetical protein